MQASFLWFTRISYINKNPDSAVRLSYHIGLRPVTLRPFLSEALLLSSGFLFVQGLIFFPLFIVIPKKLNFRHFMKK